MNSVHRSRSRTESWCARVEPLHQSDSAPVGLCTSRPCTSRSMADWCFNHMHQSAMFCVLTLFSISLSDVLDPRDGRPIVHRYAPPSFSLWESPLKLGEIPQRLLERDRYGNEIGGKIIKRFRAQTHRSLLIVALDLHTSSQGHFKGRLARKFRLPRQNRLDPGPRKIA